MKEQVQKVSIEILNMRVEKFNYAPYEFRVDRASPVGNPFYMHNESERDLVCDSYEQYFYKQLHSEQFMNYLQKILSAARTYGKVYLYCWCAPKRCHAETIRNWLYTQLNKENN